MASLRKRYVRNASALLGQSLGVGRYREVTEYAVARSLASCLDESKPSFELLLELVALHNSNLRWDPVADLFRWAVPDLQSKIHGSDAVRAWMSASIDVSESTLMNALSSELDDLVERRNEVAHRAIPDEIQSYEHLLAKVDYIEAISLGLVASLGGILIDFSIKGGDAVLLGVPTEYYKQERVVVIPGIKSAISEGDIILAPGERSVRWGRVLEIRVADERVAQAQVGAEAGLLLDFARREGGDLHVWRTPHPELAVPPAGLFGSRGPFQPA